MVYLILIVSLAGIVFGANFLVNGSVDIARRFKVSDFVIGAAIVGVGTSTPELAVSFIGALNGNADVAIGNVVGSNIFNVFGILGLTAVFFPITFGRENLKFDIPLCVGISVAKPTAIPDAPFTSKFGNPAGKSSGSFNVSSKLSLNCTVFLSISFNISVANVLILTSVYLIAAG